MVSRYKRLFKEVEACQPSSIMEIGTWNGKHAKQMIEIAQKYNNPIYYYGFDLFEEFTQSKEEHCPKAPANIHDVSLLLRTTKAKTKLFQGNTKDTLKNFQPENPVDFVFIDGGHSLETIESDWKNVQRFLHLDSVVILDDYYIETDHIGCRGLIESLSSKWKFELLEGDIFQNPKIGKQTTHLVKVQYVV